MKKSLFAGALSPVLLIAGCPTNPAAGPGGPQGPPGALGPSNQARDRDRDAARPRQAPSCPAGQRPYTDHDGRVTGVRD
jgi:hypothetical protein